MGSWVRRADIDDGYAPGGGNAQAARIKDLRREHRELLRANEILKRAVLTRGLALVLLGPPGRLMGGHAKGRDAAGPKARARTYSASHAMSKVRYERGLSGRRNHGRGERGSTQTPNSRRWWSIISHACVVIRSMS